jgi:hypothetical protein
VRSSCFLLACQSMDHYKYTGYSLGGPLSSVRFFKDTFMVSSYTPLTWRTLLGTNTFHLETTANCASSVYRVSQTIISLQSIDHLPRTSGRFRFWFIFFSSRTLRGLIVILARFLPRVPPIDSSQRRRGPLSVHVGCTIRPFSGR